MIISILGDPIMAGFVLAVAVFLSTQALKWLLIKPFTGKIGNARIRKIVNIPILFLPFILGCVAEYLYSVKFLGAAFDPVIGIGRGTASIALYSLWEYAWVILLNRKPPEGNTYETEEGKAAMTCVTEIVADGKVTKGDTSAVDKFLRKMNNE